MTPRDVDTVLDVVLDEDDIGLVNEWPKRCGCGRSYTAHEWRLLQFVGTMIDDVESCELRNCACGSTIAMAIETDTHPAYVSTLPPER